jgi:tRNA-dihydrouridine synthase A
MAEPELVGDCVAAMQAAVSLPVTVKCRIGIDDQDSGEALDRFLETVSRAGCATVIIHARKAWLGGLSPKENRDVPPLDYQRVYRVKETFPGLEIVINGGIESLDAAADHLAMVDGVMLGRAAYQNPYLLADVDRRFFGAPEKPRARGEIIEAFLPYVARELRKGTRFHHMARHLLGLYQGEPGARAWRRHLTVEGVKADAGASVLRDALAYTSRRPVLQPAGE